MGTIKLDKNGKIADPEIRAAAQALLLTFQVGGAENEKTWLKWSLGQPAGIRKEIYVLVWRIFLRTNPVAKIAKS